MEGELPSSMMVIFVPMGDQKAIANSPEGGIQTPVVLSISQDGLSMRFDIVSNSCVFYV